MEEKKNEIILFENQGVKLEVNLKEETVWLTQAQMEELFDVKHATISEHISNIFKEGELEEKTSVGISDKSTGGRKSKIYNLDVIEKSIDYINKQQFILSINELYDENLKSIIENFKFECYGAKSFLKINFNSEKFWKSFDAINEDLKKYIYSWTDIQYYNYYKFKPFDILTNKSDIRTAIIESKKHNKLK